MRYSALAYDDPRDGGMGAAHELAGAQGDFIGVEERVHLAAGGETPFLKSHVEALTRYALDKSAGLPGADRQLAIHNRARERAAALLGVSTDEVAFIPSTSDGVNMVAQTIDFKPGDNVVVETIEFPSDVYPWLLQQREGRRGPLRRRRLRGAARRARSRHRRPHPGGGALPRQLPDGRAPRSEARRRAAHAVGATFIVDASHALGVVPVDARVADFVFSCCYKWQLGCTGHRRRVLEPPASAGLGAPGGRLDVGEAGRLARARCAATASPRETTRCG